MSIARRSACLSSLAWVAAVAMWSSAPAEAQQYKKTDLVSDQAGATFQDPRLVNPWGLSRSSGSPWWSADNGTGFSTLYDGTGVAQALVVKIPSAAGDPTTGVPTGTVFNGNATDFKLPNGSAARFLFVTEDGTISGWNGGAAAVIVSASPDAVYKGVAIATRDGANYLYVANFGQRRIDVFDTTFHRVRPWHEDHDSDRDEERHEGSHGAFKDERLPRGFAPFNVQNIGGSLYVAFAKVGEGADEAQGAGLGYVDVFSPSGRLLRRFEHGPWLNAPWGMAQAPGDFGAFSHNLLVGQFGSGEIAAYDVASGHFVGTMQDAASAVLSIEGLWALSFGNGATAGPLNTLYFTAGIDDESHGLFGSLTPVSAAPLGNGQ